jgi:hypothetical protein
MKKCYEVIDEFNINWQKISGNSYPFSDVAISYMIKKYFNIEITFVPYILSQPPSHYESALNGDHNQKYYIDRPVSLEECMKNPMSFHYIKPQDMIYIYEKYKK